MGHPVAHLDHATAFSPPLGKTTGLIEAADGASVAPDGHFGCSSTSWTDPHPLNLILKWVLVLSVGLIGVSNQLAELHPKCLSGVP